MKPPVLGKKLLRDYPAAESSSGVLPREALANDTEENPLYTGRYLLILRDGNKDVVKTTKLLETKWGFLVANTADFVSEPMCESRIKDADYVVEPEKVVYIPDDVPVDTAVDSTWGIRAVKAHESAYTGAGIKVAVLDTGFDMKHPDFKGRSLTAFSFVPDEAVDDLHGHGTHCIGIVCGSSGLRDMRYGVAPEAQIYAGKVLNNGGRGAQAWILDGMTWAANNGCRVLSMSLGSKVLPGQSYDIAYERAAQFALSKGTLIVAAAGNDSRRSENQFSPVSSPADCPSILAVGAVDSTLEVADFSNRALNESGLVDLAAPGVGIYSSWPMPARYRTLSGTSMATPHVAGVVALLCEKFPDATPAMIGQELIRTAGRLSSPAVDIGAGISLAP